MSAGRPETRTQIAQVGEIAGVGRDTVRNFFNRPGLLSAETRQRVATAVAEVGYRPARKVGRALKGVRVGYELPRTWASPSPVMVQQLSALVAAVHASGGELVPFVVQPEVAGVWDVVGGTQSERSNSRLGLQGWYRDYAQSLAVATYRDTMKSHGVQAFLVNDLRISDDRLDALRSEGVPYVALGRPRDAAGVPADAHPYVETDNAQGIAAMVGLLRAAGCLNFAHLGFDTDGSAVPAARSEAVSAAAGSETPHMTIHYEESVRPSVPQVTSVARWLESHPTVDALICDSDALAYIAHLAAPMANRSTVQDPDGLRDQPRALMLSGNDNSVYRTLAEPRDQWMTMRSDGVKEAEAAIDLLARIRTGASEPVSILIPPNVIGAPGRGADSIIELGQG